MSQENICQGRVANARCVGQDEPDDMAISGEQGCRSISQFSANFPAFLEMREGWAASEIRKLRFFCTRKLKMTLKLNELLFAPSVSMNLEGNGFVMDTEINSSL